MPSGRRRGPEKSRSTVRDACAGLALSEPLSASAEGPLVIVEALDAAGIPGGWSRPVSLGADATVVLAATAACFQG
eukprot:3173562-Pleurochrysis_carterae.AAC.1